MNKNNILLLIIVLLIASCASFKPQYREDAQQIFPTGADIDRSFYLIGDVGLSPMNGKSDGLIALESYILKNKTDDSHLIFLGDNIYPTGMPPKENAFRPKAENHLNAQIEVAKVFDGTTIFIPGNHDWFNEGLDNVEREKNYIEEALENKDIWQPRVGCPIESLEISNDIQLIIVDSQWYLARWDLHPTINDDCDQIKTREQLFLEIESELKKNQDKTIVFALHHPLYTNGVHGGQYAAIKHLYPSQSAFPVPILGSLATQIRTSGGVSAQDKQNKRYQELAQRISTLARASAAPRIIFASGHEHTLQYIEHEGVRQIVSGSGSKKSYSSLSYDGLFSYGGNGFARLDIMKDGSSWVRYYGFEDGREMLLFTHKAIEAPEQYDLEQLPVEYPAFAKASVYDQERVEKSSVYESVWGTKYRDLYGTKINAKVGILDSLKGGLTVARSGGGHQTRSLRLVGPTGKEYNLRALKKSAVQFLQTTVFKENAVAESFEATATEDLLFDFYTAAHPYAALTIPKLSDAIGVYHTNPEIYYVPKQKALGNYNNEYGDELYMLVERPEANHKDLATFGTPENIESTADVFEKLRRDEKYKVDEPFYIKARMFDMLLGDWDRHQDQWRWSEYEDEQGNFLFKAIPRDRDQVFSNFDGAVFATLRTMIGLTKQFATYDEDLNNVKWFNTAASYLDRSLAQNSDRNVWIEQARYIQDNLTDEVIEEAFKDLPEEIYTDASTARIIKNLKIRRGNLVKIAERYYEYLSKLAILRGTDKDDIIEINRIADGKTKITIYRNKDGEKSGIVAERLFLRDETREIWVYALDDDDIIYATGTGKDKIKVRVIGGQNNDVYDLENGDDISIYDHKSKENTIVNLGGARKRLSDSYDRNLYNPKKNIKTANVLTPAIGFNPDDGFKIGVQNIFSVQGFNRNPNSRVHKFVAGYYFATQGYDIDYQGTFAGIFNDLNVVVNARFAGPTFAENFFGLGNETVNNDDTLDFDFNRVRISEISSGVGVVYNGEYGSNIKGGIEIQGFQVEEDADRFLATIVDPVANSSFYERKWFIDLNGGYNYESYDNTLNPTRGMIFDLQGGVNLNTDDTNAVFGYLKPKLGFYNALNRKRNVVLKTLAQATVNFGDDYQFYQSAQVGQNNGLRGYRNQRFSGESALALSADVRYSFEEFKTGLIPIQMGIFLGGDVGRVWLDEEDSQRWHNDFGGGFWVNSSEAISATFNLFRGDDGLRFSFQVGFSF